MRFLRTLLLVKCALLYCLWSSWPRKPSDDPKLGHDTLVQEMKWYTLHSKHRGTHTHREELRTTMLPLSLLKTAQGQPMLVELKNGDTYNGNLVNCDTWMNINLREVICTSKDGDRFWKMPECYIRGNSVKYIRVPNEILDMVQEDDFSKRDRQANRGRGRGGRGGVGFRGGRGGGRGGPGGRGDGAGGRGGPGGNRGGRGGGRGGGRFTPGRGGGAGRGQ